MQQPKQLRQCPKQQSLDNAKKLSVAITNHELIAKATFLCGHVFGELYKYFHHSINVNKQQNVCVTEKCDEVCCLIDDEDSFNTIKLSFSEFVEVVDKLASIVGIKSSPDMSAAIYFVYNDHKPVTILPACTIAILRVDFNRAALEICDHNNIKLSSYVDHHEGDIPLPAIYIQYFNLKESNRSENKCGYFFV